MADPFHTEYRALDPVEQARVKEVKRLAAALYGVIDSTGPGREQSIAKTKLEEVAMWAVKGITK